MANKEKVIVRTKKMPNGQVLLDGSVTTKGKKPPKAAAQFKTSKKTDAVVETTDVEESASMRKYYLEKSYTVGTESELREEVDTFLGGSNFFSKSDISSEIFSLDEIRQIVRMEREGRILNRATWQYQKPINKIIARRLLQRSLAKIASKFPKTETTGQERVINFERDWKSEPVSLSNGSDGGDHNIALPSRKDLVTAFCSGLPVHLNNLSEMFSNRSPGRSMGKFEGSLLISVSDDGEMKIDYSKITCLCSFGHKENGVPGYGIICHHLASIKPALVQRIIGIRYTNPTMWNNR